jgi:trimethylamine--corrinoid protein Co-methyltransferase
MAEMAHHFNLPNFGTAGTSDSQIFDGQAVLEVTSSCLLAALVGANLIHDVGLLGNATLVIPEMIVATNEIIHMVQHVLRDTPVDKESLALDIIASAGPGGEFVTHPHTLERFREVWYPNLLYRGGGKTWSTSQQFTFEQRVHARTRELIRAHHPQPLPEDTIVGIQQIMARSER